MEEDACHDRRNKAPQIGHIGGVAVAKPRPRAVKAVKAVKEPKGVLDLIHCHATRLEDRRQHFVWKRNEIPTWIVGNLKRDDIGSTSLHLECEETARRPDLKNPFAGEFVVPKIFVYSAAEISLPLNDTVFWHFNSVVEFAVFKSHVPRRRKYLFCHADLPRAPPSMRSH